MRTLRQAWSQIAAKPSRIVATVVAIVIGVGFACAALVFTSTFQQNLAAEVSAPYSRADVVVTPQTDGPAALAHDVAAVPGVDAAEPLYESSVEYTSAASHNYLHLMTYPTVPELRWAGLDDGHWPTAPDEIVVSSQTATSANLPVGATLTLTGVPGADDATPPTVQATVVGIANIASSPLTSGRPTAFAAPGTFTALHVTYTPMIAVTAADGTAPATLAQAVHARLGDATTVRTTAEQAGHDVAMFTGQTSVLTTVLLGFAFIALLVAGIVIANTFTILLTQRRRQIALLRCVGATGRQVRAEVIAESALIGVLGSVLGAGAGIGVGMFAASVGGLTAGGYGVPVSGLVIVALIGVALTVGAALLPASRAMRIPPLAALSPVPPPERARRTGIVRIVVGAVLVAFGGLLLVLGVLVGSILAAMPGGALSAIGVLLLSRSFLPPLLRAIGGIGRVAGVPGRLAASNAVRNPGRAAATSAALVVGVGLIVMLQVAAASANSTIDNATAERYPVDVSVAGDGAPLPNDVISGVKATPELAGSVALAGTDAAVTVPGEPDFHGGVAADTAGVGLGDGGAAGAGHHVTLIGVPPDAAGVARGGVNSLESSDGGAPVALVPRWWVGSGQVSVGDLIKLTVGGRSQQFTVAVGHLGDAGVTRPSVMTTSAAVHALAPEAPPVVMWAALGHGDRAPQAMSALNSLVADQPGIFVTGSAAQRASVQSVLNTVTTVATGLLAVAVVIAIVGIGNTIGLSVVERTRESALLRALGLRRAQLRLMLAAEALLLALIGALVGIVLGLIYGFAGAAAAFGAAHEGVVLSVPWGVVGLVLLVAVAAGVLASVLPARRAAKAQPVAALAEE